MPPPPTPCLRQVAAALRHFDALLLHLHNSGAQNSFQRRPSGFSEVIASASEPRCHCILLKCSQRGIYNKSCYVDASDVKIQVESSTHGLRLPQKLLSVDYSCAAHRLEQKIYILISEAVRSSCCGSGCLVATTIRTRLKSPHNRFKMIWHVLQAACVLVRMIQKCMPSVFGNRNKKCGDSHCLSTSRPHRVQAQQTLPDASNMTTFIPKIRSDPNDPGEIHSPLDPSIESAQLGVFKIFSMKPNSAFLSLIGPLRGLKNAFPTAKKLTMDIATLAPVLFPLLCLETMLYRVAPVLMWHFLNRIIFVLEAGLSQGQLDTVALVHAMVARISFSVMLAAVHCWSRHAEIIVQNRIVQHFETMSFEWKARADKSTLEECEKNEFELTYVMVWYNYRDLLSAAGGALSILCQLYYIATLVNSRQEALVYMLLFLISTFTSDLQQCISARGWAATSVNPYFNRMLGLKLIVSKPEYKHELISGNLADYLVQEYRKARRLLGDASASYPPHQYDSHVRVELEIFSNLIGDLHLFYFVGAAILYPSGLTLSKIMMLPKAGEMITTDLKNLMNDLREAETNLTSVTRMYNLANLRETMPDGHLSLRPAPEDGISLRLENVQFSYPSGKSQANALHDVSFSVAAGQLVVIVGTSGSGKSTLINLLARIHDCSSGRISLDGHDIREYKIDELRQATAILMQDHHHYPLSFAENIGIGNPAEVANERLIEESARKGGAHDFISTRYGEKYDTILEPPAMVLEGNLSQSDDDPLVNVRRSFDKSGSLSGGERQRLAASRTFMRLSSKLIRLVIADEPTSSLDADAESSLLENLLKERKGKTMIFVTHRFGMLTQRADLILCMRDGRVVEEGRHAALMALKGDYFRLYSLQANAFKQPTA